MPVFLVPEDPIIILETFCDDFSRAVSLLWIPDMADPVLSCTDTGISILIVSAICLTSLY